MHSTRNTNRIYYLVKVVVNRVILLFCLHDLTKAATCSILLYWLHDLSIVTICSWYQAYHHNCIWIRNIRSIYLSYDRTGMIDVCGIVGTCLTSKERKCYILSTASIGNMSEWLHWSLQQAQYRFEHISIGTIQSQRYQYLCKLRSGDGKQKNWSHSKSYPHIFCSLAWSPSRGYHLLILFIEALLLLNSCSLRLCKCVSLWHTLDEEIWYSNFARRFCFCWTSCLMRYCQNGYGR